MNSEMLRQLLSQPESPKLDFKVQFYRIADEKAREEEWGEFIKDILALANGNAHAAGQMGYLVIGAGDKLRPDGTRELCDVGDIKPNTRQILDKVNERCRPPLEDIQCDTVELDGKHLLVISIPPSPYLHETTRPINAQKKIYHMNSVFIRLGEEISLASTAQRQAILRAKRAVHSQAVTVDRPSVEEEETQRPFTRHQLLFSPAPLPKGLVGREAEISTLLEALKDPELTIIWIGGIPGIGKTYLAARLHREVSEQGECQPLWMDCKERSVTLEVLLDALAELSGDPELLKLTQDPSTRPEDRVEQVLQRFMEPQKVVLFVEDYHRLEGLGEHHRLDELLIQAARHCEQTKIILVGRVRPGVLDNHRLHGAFLEHPMEGLGEEYTREFVNIPNLTDEQAHKIWKQCASGTPIAMSIFGQEVNKRSLSDLLALPIWGIANTKQQWLDPVVENLTLSERACLQAASVFSADIPHSALAYIYDRDDLQSAMDGLLDKGLLVHKPGSDRYAVWHDCN